MIVHKWAVKRSLARALRELVWRIIVIDKDSHPSLRTHIGTLWRRNLAPGMHTQMRKYEALGSYPVTNCNVKNGWVAMGLKADQHSNVQDCITIDRNWKTVRSPRSERSFKFHFMITLWGYFTVEMGIRCPIINPKEMQYLSKIFDINSLALFSLPDFMG